MGSALLLVFLVLMIGLVSGNALALVIINEIHADPDSTDGDANGDGTRHSSADEFVEIVNNGDSDLDISGWNLSDGVSVRHVFPGKGDY